MKDKQKIVYFNSRGHLNDETIALFAKRIMTNDESIEIPSSVIAHFEECEDCKTEILDFVEVIADSFDYVTPLLKNQIESEPKKSHQEKVKPKIRQIILSRTFRICSLAAILLVFMAVSWFVRHQVSPERLFGQYFSPYKNVITIKGTNDKKLAEGMLLYDLKMYDSAIVVFTEAFMIDSLNRDIKFYLANSLLASEMADEAVPLFYQLQQEKNGKYNIPSNWFLGLSYLKMNEIDRASLVFKEIAEQKNSYSDKAKQILRKLD